MQVLRNPCMDPAANAARSTVALERAQRKVDAMLAEDATDVRKSPPRLYVEGDNGERIDVTDEVFKRA